MRTLLTASFPESSLTFRGGSLYLLNANFTEIVIRRNR